MPVAPSEIGNGYINSVTDELDEAILDAPLTVISFDCEIKKRVLRKDSKGIHPGRVVGKHR